MRFLSADTIYPIHKPPVKNGIVIIDDKYRIVDMLDPLNDDVSSINEVEKYSGILCPGFINTHCHLELSHLKGKLSQKKGLPYFIEEIIKNRVIDNDDIVEAMFNANLEMYEEGIVAVGDISNSSISGEVKQMSKLFYHTFIELFDIFPERAELHFKKGLSLESEFKKRNLNSSLTPHASYTVSNDLLKLICEYATEHGSILTIHNQETLSENEMFEMGSGVLIEKLKNLTGALEDWKPSMHSSIQTLIDYFPTMNNLQFVHNTYTSKDDVIQSSKKINKIYWCLCVNANLFIENAVPDVKMLMDQNCRITIGTDSYASNNSLSILSELKTISSNFPEIPLNELLGWATLNGASFLEIEEKFGSFEKGKSPGINLISNTQFGIDALTKESNIKRIV